MGIDPSDERIEPFYNKMKELNMVMFLNIVARLSVAKYSNNDNSVLLNIVTMITIIPDITGTLW